jgi:MraZ protein
MVVSGPMFIGEYEYRMDEKGRVPIPPRFRTEELKKEGVVLCPGVDKCITIYPNSEWKKVADALISGPIMPSKMRKLNRAFFATSFNVEIDGQGRIMVPVQLRQHADIKDEVVVTGVNTILELWDKEQWAHEKPTFQAEVGQIIETLERH